MAITLPTLHRVLVAPSNLTRAASDPIRITDSIFTMIKKWWNASSNSRDFKVVMPMIFAKLNESAQKRPDQQLTGNLLITIPLSRDQSLQLEQYGEFGDRLRITLRGPNNKESSMLIDDGPGSMLEQFRLNLAAEYLEHWHDLPSGLAYADYSDPKNPKPIRHSELLAAAHRIAPPYDVDVARHRDQVEADWVNDSPDSCLDRSYLD